LLLDGLNINDENHEVNLTDGLKGYEAGKRKKRKSAQPLATVASSLIEYETALGRRETFFSCEMA